MCTVTIVPLSRGARDPSSREPEPAGWRLACNRDELRTRPEALAPRIQTCGERRAILPLDPPSGGTWIGVNDAGLAATVLNVNLSPGARPAVAAGLRSRGTIIPDLLSRATLDEAVQRAGDLDPRAYPPLRLVLLDGRDLAHLVSDGCELRCERARLGDIPHLFTSSGLGDALVEGPRRELFEQHFTPDKDWIRQQDAFHRHAWPARRHLSVCMEREDARTVSHTIIELVPRHVRMTYFPDAPGRCRPLPPVTLSRQEPG